MNDRFKFRVWNKSKNRYITEDIASLYLYSDGKFEVHYHGQHEPTETNTNDAIIEFATGLRDKNGNLIYANDICRVKVVDGGYETVLVVWNGTAWCFQCGFWIKLMCFWNPDEIEIICNVHEQKE